MTGVCLLQHTCIFHLDLQSIDHSRVGPLRGSMSPLGLLPSQALSRLLHGLHGEEGLLHELG